MADKETLYLSGSVPSPEDQDIIQMVRKFVANEVIPTAAEYDLKGELNWDAYNKAFEMGIINVALPAQYGGQGLSQVTSNWISEELMYGDAGFALAGGSNALGMETVLLFGNDAQKDYAVSTLMSDKPGRDPRWPKKRSGFCSFALTEPEAGSDAAACKTVATKTADGKEYILNGRKCFITNAPYADFFVVIASINREAGYKGLTAFLVPADTPGVSIGKHEDKMGIRQSATADVVFEDARIPASALIGEEGMGFIYAMKTLEFGRGGVGASCTGIGKRALDIAAKYAQERCTMGKPIYKQQLISAKLADMQIGVEVMRSIGMRVATAIDAKDMALAGKLGPIAKTYCSDTLQKIVNDCVQILGGYGYMREYPAEKLMRDARIFQIFEGTNEIQRVVIGGNVIKEHKI